MLTAGEIGAPGVKLKYTVDGAWKSPSLTKSFTTEALPNVAYFTTKAKATLN